MGYVSEEVGKMKGLAPERKSMFHGDSWPTEKVPLSPQSFPPPDRKKELVVAKKVGMV